MKIAFFSYKKVPQLVFLSSKSEYQLPMKSEEADHECVIWSLIASGQVLMIPMSATKA